MSQPNETNLIELTADIVSAFVSNNRVGVEQLPQLIRSTYESLQATETPAAAAEEPAETVFERPVSVRKSLASPDVIISMIDGKPYKMLKRHLATHGLTPEEYRQRYKLPADYPMVAPNYAAFRRETAVKLGLGRAPTRTRKGGRGKGGAGE